MFNCPDLKFVLNLCNIQFGTTRSAIIEQYPNVEMYLMNGYWHCIMPSEHVKRELKKVFPINITENWLCLFDIEDLCKIQNMLPIILYNETPKLYDELAEDSLLYIDEFKIEGNLCWCPSWFNAFLVLLLFQPPFFILNKRHYSWQ